MDVSLVGPHVLCLSTRPAASNSSQRQEGILVSYCLHLGRPHRILYAVNNICNTQRQRSTATRSLAHHTSPHSSPPARSLTYLTPHTPLHIHTHIHTLANTRECDRAPGTVTVCAAVCHVFISFFLPPALATASAVPSDYYTVIVYFSLESVCRDPPCVYVFRPLRVSVGSRGRGECIRVVFPALKTYGRVHKRMR